MTALKRIKFQDSPAQPTNKTTRRRDHWSLVCEQLAARPNQWALVAQNHSASTATYLRKKHGLEVALRRAEKNSSRADLYARYVPAAPTVVHESVVAMDGAAQPDGTPASWVHI